MKSTSQQTFEIRHATLRHIANLSPNRVSVARHSRINKRTP